MPTLATPAPATPRLQALVAATPPDRDRAIDLLRALSILVVALGHWLLAVVTVGPEGTISGQNALASVPALQRMTWAFQVMPLFFLVGGWANARSWRAARRRGQGWATWVAARLRRLTGPATLFVVVWALGGAALAAMGIDRELLTLGAALVAVPLWFLAVYVVVVAAAPAMLWLHERAGLTVPIALAVAAAGVDMLHRQGVPLIGWSNFLLVWAIPQQLGFAWADGRLERRRWVGPAVALGGLLALLALTSIGPYPVSMVGVPGAAVSNNAPPTVALVALTVWQLGAAVTLAGPLRRWAQRPRVWLAVIAVNARAMTIYLWHLTALIIVAVVVVPTGLLGAPEPGTVTWWTTRPVWLAVCTLALVPLVALSGRAERLGASTAAAGRIAVTLAVAAAAGAFGALATAGLHRPEAATGIPLTAVAGLLLAGLILRGRQAGAACIAVEPVPGTDRPPLHRADATR